MKRFFALLGLFFVFLTANLLLTLYYHSHLKDKAFYSQILSEISPEEGPAGKGFAFSPAPFVIGDQEPDISLVDERVANLKSFFRRHNSPLYDLAEKIVEVSDNYGIDYRLLPAIAMQESTLCRSIPANSYNCWGWGINSSQTIRFSSYEEGIERVARGLKENYVDKGLVTPEAIMAKYAPHSTSWADGINQFLTILDR